MRTYYSRLALVLLAGFAFVLPSTAFAVGEAIAPSVTFAPSARGEGMGRAYVAIADDATASWWNPAGLAFLANRNISAMHTKLAPGRADDVYYEYLAYAQSSEDWGGLAASLVYLTYGDIEGRDEFGNPTSVFTSYEISPAVGYGTRCGRTGCGHQHGHPSALRRQWSWRTNRQGHDVRRGRGRALPEQVERGRVFQNIDLTSQLALTSRPDQQEPQGQVAAIWRAASAGLCAFDVSKPFVRTDDGPILGVGGSSSSVSCWR
jgi:hypothetical protein